MRARDACGQVWEIGSANLALAFGRSFLYLEPTAVCRAAGGPATDPCPSIARPGANTSSAGSTADAADAPDASSASAGVEVSRHVLLRPLVRETLVLLHLLRVGHGDLHALLFLHRDALGLGRLVAFCFRVTMLSRL